MGDFAWFFELSYISFLSAVRAQREAEKPEYKAEKRCADVIFRQCEIISGTLRNAVNLIKCEKFCCDRLRGFGINNRSLKENIVTLTPHWHALPRFLAIDRHTKQLTRQCTLYWKNFCNVILWVLLLLSMTFLLYNSYNMFIYSLAFWAKFSWKSFVSVVGSFQATICGGKNVV